MAREKIIYKVSQNLTKMPGDQSCCFSCAVHNDDLEGFKNPSRSSQVLSDSQTFTGKIATQLTTREISKLLDFKKTPLYSAAETNDVSLIRTLLQQNVDVEGRSHNNLTPLHIAAQLGNTKSAEILLNHGADTNSVCAWALCTLLYAAIRKGRKALVELLLKKAAIVNVKTDGMLLDLAATRNHRAVVKLLLDNNDDVDVRNENNENMLRLAVERWNLPLIEQILEASCDLRNNRVDMQNDILEVLLQHGFRVLLQRDSRVVLHHGFRVGSEDSKECILLHHAIRSGYMKIVEYLLNLGTDCNTKSKLKGNSTPLHTAIAHSQIEIAKRLIKNNADVNAEDGLGRTPLHYVLYIFNADHPSMGDFITMLLVSGARVNEPAEGGKTALQIAANEGYAKIVELLLQHKADVNSVDERMETPLHSSARSGNTKTIKILLDNGARVDAKRNDGATALHIAVKRGQVEPVKLLIENGADTATRDRFRVTPLHIAVTGYSSKIVEILLDTCDDVDGRDENGKTALHFAAMYGSFPFVRALLDRGADINVCCNHGFTPVNCTDGPGSEWDNHINSDYYVLDDSHSDRSIMDDIELWEDRKETMLIFVEHIAKMTALSRWVNKQNLDAIKYYDYKHVHAQCASEIKCLRQKMIGSSNVSYYDILTKGMKSLIAYARNKYITHALETVEHKDVFPLYSAMLHRRFKMIKGEPVCSI